MYCYFRNRYTHAALRTRNLDLPDSLVAMTGFSRKNLISNHRTRRDGKTMTRTMRQTEACSSSSSFVRIQHGCSRSEALFRSSCGQCNEEGDVVRATALTT